MVETLCVRMKGKKNKEDRGEQTSGCRRSYLVRSSEDLVLNLLGSMTAGCFSATSYECRSTQFQSVRSQASRAEHQLGLAGICFQNLGRKWRCTDVENKNRQNKRTTAMLFPHVRRKCMQSKFNWSSGCSAL